MSDLDNQCCVEECKTAVLDRCGDFVVTRSVDLGDLDCIGRLLRVPVKLRACRNKKVNVAALVCDDKNKIQGMKVVQLEPICPTSGNECEFRETEFCFPIPDTVCKGATFKIKVIASYAPDEKCPCI